MCQPLSERPLRSAQARLHPDLCKTHRRSTTVEPHLAPTPVAPSNMHPAQAVKGCLPTTTTSNPRLKPCISFSLPLEHRPSPHDTATLSLAAVATVSPAHKASPPLPSESALPTHLSLLPRQFPLSQYSSVFTFLPLCLAYFPKYGSLHNGPFTRSKPPKSSFAASSQGLQSRAAARSRPAKFNIGHGTKMHGTRSVRITRLDSEINAHN
jgi:hypothetical protein